MSETAMQGADDTITKTTEVEPTATPRRRQSAETRARLLRAALTLFRARGYHGAGTNDIGAEAGLTGPSIYRHFANKDDVLVAAVLEAARQLDEGAVAAHREPDPFASLQILCRSFAATGVGDPELFAVYFFEARHASEAATAQLYDTGQRYLRRFEGPLAELLPELSAAEIRIRTQAAIYMTAGMCLQPVDPPPDRLASVLADRMMAVLLAPSPRRPRAR